jgi:hypothetical protein
MIRSRPRGQKAVQAEHDSRLRRGSSAHLHLAGSDVHDTAIRCHVVPLLFESTGLLWNRLSVTPRR